MEPILDQQNLLDRPRYSIQYRIVFFFFSSSSVLQQFFTMFMSIVLLLTVQQALSACVPVCARTAPRCKVRLWTFTMSSEERPAPGSGHAANGCVVLDKDERGDKGRRRKGEWGDQRKMRERGEGRREEIKEETIGNERRKKKLEKERQEEKKEIGRKQMRGETAKGDEER
ncbi:hypothetical protein WMY93_025625 [Mugilogobius chulae]|uniref:Uncharacterized protein n=1 Tax=Mugilogobius chulae TaxID=88201 RepID=A0AAW0MW49_9GOBI